MERNQTAIRGIVTGMSVAISTGNRGLIIKPEVASKQLEQEASVMETPEVTQNGLSIQVSDNIEITDTVSAETSSFTTKPLPCRFHGSVKVDPIRVGRDSSRIAQEVIQHLVGLSDANIEVTLEIQANIPDGAPEKVVRDVTENCRTLKFDTFGFEEM